MAKIKKEEVKVENNKEVDTVSESQVVEIKETSFPEVRGTGKFQSVKVDGGYALYNPDGVRVSGVLSDRVVKDMVLRQNTAAQIK